METKSVRRGLSLKIFDWGEIEQAGGMKVRQHVGLRSGLPVEHIHGDVRLFKLFIELSSSAGNSAK